MSADAPHVLPYAGISPSFATPPIHAGAASAVLGRVTLGRNAWLGALSVIRADGHFVRVGDDFHLGARSTLHINHEIFPCIVGDRVSVGVVTRVIVTEAPTCMVPRLQLRTPAASMHEPFVG